MSIPGSLTEHLIATGHPFSVNVLQQGTDAACADETAIFEITPNSALYTRHVCLQLTDTAVVFARSVCLPDCPVWQPILDRGSRSLGLSLFGGLAGLSRGTLDFADIAAPHPLFALSQQHDPQAASRYPARRCRFTLNGHSLLVCETFLPALENFL